MNTNDHGGLAGSAVSEASLAVARDVLRDADRWSATARRWQKIDHVLLAMLAALDAGDDVAFRDATADLEEISPRRASEAGTDPKKPPHPPVRDRLNETIHRIGK